MATMYFPDGSSEDAHAPNLKELFEDVEDALDRGAEKVTIYPEPHVFLGVLRRCELCGHTADNDIHDVSELVKEIQDLSNKIAEADVPNFIIVPVKENETS